MLLECKLVDTDSLIFEISLFLLWVFYEVYVAVTWIWKLNWLSYRMHLPQTINTHYLQIFEFFFLVEITTPVELKGLNMQ